MCVVGTAIPGRELADIPCLVCLHPFPDVSSCSWQVNAWGVFRGEPRPCHTLHFADAVPGNRCLAQDSCLGARVHVRIAFSFLGFLSASFSALPSPSMVCPWSPTLPGKALVLSAAVTVLACAAIDVSVCPTPSTIRLHSVVNNWSSARSYCVQGMLSGSAAVRHNAYGHQL